MDVSPAADLQGDLPDRGAVQRTLSFGDRVHDDVLLRLAEALPVPRLRRQEGVHRLELSVDLTEEDQQAHMVVFIECFSSGPETRD